jgi:large subunit ribosomal protein L24
MASKWKVKKGDKVVVIAGRDKGKQGEVLRVLREDNRVIVQGVHVVKRHTRQSASSAGGIVEKESSVHISNVAHVDPKSGKPTRVGYKFLEDGRKIRFARRSGETIDV